MWLFSTSGFYTVVEHRDQPGTLIVRARVKKDLATLKDKYMPDMGKITYHKDYDYPYRGFISKEGFGAGLAKMALDIDYEKFKEAVRKTQGSKRAGLYTEVWGKMIKLEADPNRIHNYYSRQSSLFADRYVTDERDAYWLRDWPENEELPRSETRPHPRIVHRRG